MGEYLLIDARDITVQHHAPGLFCNHYPPDDPRNEQPLTLWLSAVQLP